VLFFEAIASKGTMFTRQGFGLGGLLHGQVTGVNDLLS